MKSRKRVSGLLQRNFRFRSPAVLYTGVRIQKLNGFTDSNVGQYAEWLEEYSNRRISWKTPLAVPLVLSVATR
ncbi:MAG: hypothetical protein AB9834_07515 [Lentimicrobium sp.]